ncbi:MAG: helix-turn-helix domain-containing protein [Methyloligellaceae bacterium]
MDTTDLADFRFAARPARAPLDRFVETLWHAKGRVPYAEERILPNARPVLIINLGDGFEIANGGLADAKGLKRTAWICGVQSGFLINRPLGRTEMVGATLRPAGLPALAGETAAAFADRAPDLDCLWPGRCELLRDRLWSCPTPAGRLDLLERFLAARLSEATVHAEVHAALRLLGGNGRATVGATAVALERSRKHLAGLFRYHVGVPPRTYARIARFNRLLSVLAERPDLALAQCALRSGYYDQPHLNRDFSEFAGLAPSAYLAQRERHLGAHAESEESRNFVPVR